MQLAPQACSRRTGRDSPPEQAALELRLERQLGCDKTKGRMEASIPRGEQHPEESGTQRGAAPGVLGRAPVSREPWEAAVGLDGGRLRSGY